jgi:acyl carrier protein
MTLDKDVLLSFMADKLGVDTSDLDDESLVFSTGIIDSVGMVQLIAFVESGGRVKFQPDDITLEHLDSIGRILQFVTDRQEP